MAWLSFDNLMVWLNPTSSKMPREGGGDLICSFCCNSKLTHIICSKQKTILSVKKYYRRVHRVKRVFGTWLILDAMLDSGNSIIASPGSADAKE